MARRYAGSSPGPESSSRGPTARSPTTPGRADSVALIAAGVGVTHGPGHARRPPYNVDVVVIVRASSYQDLVLRDEVAALVERRGGQAYAVVGPRQTARFDADALAKFVPDLALRDVFVCGPGGFTEPVIASALALGVPRSRIHLRSFRLLIPDRPHSRHVSTKSR